MSLDLAVPANDGYIWDFAGGMIKTEQLQIVDEQKPLFLMMSPECMPYLNKSKT